MDSTGKVFKGTLRNRYGTLNGRVNESNAPPKYRQVKVLREVRLAGERLKVVV